MSRKMQNTEANETVETKAKRDAIGATVAGVLLIVFLVIFLIIQFAMMGVKKAEEKNLRNQVEYYKQLGKETEKDLDFFKTEEGLRMLAVMNGWKKSSGGK